jgi:hypothetical protein
MEIQRLYSLHQCSLQLNPLSTVKEVSVQWQPEMKFLIKHELTITI